MRSLAAFDTSYGDDERRGSASVYVRSLGPLALSLDATTSRSRHEDGPVHPERTIRSHPMILTGGGQASSVSPHAGTVFLYGLAVGEGVGLADGVDSDGAGDGEGEGVGVGSGGHAFVPVVSAHVPRPPGNGSSFGA